MFCPECGSPARRAEAGVYECKVCSWTGWLDSQPPVNICTLKARRFRHYIQMLHLINNGRSSNRKIITLSGCKNTAILNRILIELSDFGLIIHERLPNGQFKNEITAKGTELLRFLAK